MRVLGLDCETSGLDPATHFLTEVGWVLFDEHWNVLNKHGSLIANKNRPPLTPEIIQLTKLTDEQLDKEGKSLESVLEDLANVEGYDCVVAHNLPFDLDFLKAGYAQVGYEAGDLILKPWLCSNADVVQHVGKRCRKLSHMGIDYGLCVDGSKLHRAVDDVLLMGQVLKACGAKADDMLAYQLDPWVYLQALTEKPWVDSGKSTDLAKADGYGWQQAVGTYSPKFDKAWVKRVKQKDLEAEKAKVVGFQRQVISE